MHLNVWPSFIRVDLSALGLKPRHMALFTLSLIPKWAEVPVYKLRYRAFEMSLRWPWPVQLKLHLTQYRTGGFLAPHIDETFEEEKQVNAILTLRAPKRGGELVSERYVYNGKRLKIIEPNRYRHEVTPVEEGERKVLIFIIRFPTKRMARPPF